MSRYSQAVCTFMLAVQVGLLGACAQTHPLPPGGNGQGLLPPVSGNPAVQPEPQLPAEPEPDPPVAEQPPVPPPIILDPFPDPTTLPPDPDPAAFPSGDYQFSVTVYEESYRYGGSAEGYSVRWSAYEGERWWNLTGSADIPLMEVEVVAEQAEGIRMAFIDLGFDNERLELDYATTPETFGMQRLSSPAGHMTEQPDDPVSAGFVSLMLRPQEQTGLSGDEVVVALYYFREGKPGSFKNAAPRVANLQDCRAVLRQDTAAGSIGWNHSLVGDFDQNGVVNMFDWSELAYFWGDSDDDPDSLVGWIAGAPSMTIGSNFIGPLLGHYRLALDGYNVYSGSMADFPDNGNLLGSVAITEATGEPNVDRLHYSFTPGDPPIAGSVFWVRPYLGNQEGIESHPLEIAELQ